MRIQIETIPHAQQRYNTAGDWWVDAEGVLQVRVSEMRDPRYAGLVAIHELVEVLTEGLKVSDDGTLKVPHWLVAQTDKYDETYEKQRHKGDDYSEPGYEPSCPVYQGHMIASAVEHLVAMLLHIDFNQYQKAMTKL